MALFDKAKAVFQKQRWTFLLFLPSIKKEKKIRFKGKKNATE
uniref:Uncharacterized protein n=1 Tax=Rhizophora mucronata TaxID=61149 RepID=A0A2P2NA86_RHIMU